MKTKTTPTLYWRGKPQFVSILKSSAAKCVTKSPNLLFSWISKYSYHHLKLFHSYLCTLLRVSQTTIWSFGVCLPKMKWFGYFVIPVLWPSEGSISFKTVQTKLKKPLSYFCLKKVDLDSLSNYYYYFESALANLFFFQSFDLVNIVVIQVLSRGGTST